MAPATMSCGATTSATVSTVAIGDDDLEGDSGNDFLIGGPGNDDYSGGDGADKVSFKLSPTGVEADMLLGFATGEGDDSLFGDVEILVGSQFNDTFTGGGGSVATNFRFIGNDGKDTARRVRLQRHPQGWRW